ncbi:MAG TPA: 4Fe-4S binding protein [Phototrophicaceae bacterium]|nr:4Fe-4S binding protein [Phototrophicaceae bacterium]
MYGQGILKGLFVTFKHFFGTYWDDLRYAGRKYFRQDNFAVRQGLRAQGAFTVQYPDEKIAVPERFRFTPFLVVNDADHPEAPGEDWCTSCGICAKVCPPQCIWIVRGADPVSGRPIPQPDAFFIDTDICMNCGFCAEFCPFDAIKMDHDYEMAGYDRTRNHIHDKNRLSKPLSYWKTIAPTTALEEAVSRGGWEHPDIIKTMKKAGKTPVTPTVDNMFAQPMTDAQEIAAATKQAEVTGAVATQDILPEDAEKAARLAKREAALARKRAAEQGAPAAPTIVAEVAPAAQSTNAAEVVDTQVSAEKPKFDKQAMLEKIRQKKAK